MLTEGDDRRGSQWPVLLDGWRDTLGAMNVWGIDIKPTQ